MSSSKNSKYTNCKKCTLNGNKVYGEIGRKHGILFLGEAPGREEVEQERVFVGMAGHILDNILEMVQLEKAKRENITIINTVLCRPPKNRDPSRLELKCCRKRVLHTIEKVSPLLIVILGRVAFKSLFQRSPVQGEHFQRLQWNGITTLYLYHPAYFLYNKDYNLMKQCSDSIRMALEGVSWDA